MRNMRVWRETEIRKLHGCFIPEMIIAFALSASFFVSCFPQFYCILNRKNAQMLGWGGCDSISENGGVWDSICFVGKADFSDVQNVTKLFEVLETRNRLAELLQRDSVVLELPGRFCCGYWHFVSGWTFLENLTLQVSECCSFAVAVSCEWLVLARTGSTPSLIVQSWNPQWNCASRSKKPSGIFSLLKVRIVKSFTICRSENCEFLESHQFVGVRVTRWTDLDCGS